MPKHIGFVMNFIHNTCLELNWDASSLADMTDYTIICTVSEALQN